MNQPFLSVSPTVDFAAMDREILQFWKEAQIFKRSEERKASAKTYVFYDGPPGTNGIPHIGHIMQSSLKDVWPRFKTMQGYKVLRKGGWDTHGLPVELTAEKDLGLSGKRDIEKYGVPKFMDHCRNTVLRYRDQWVQAITRIGRFLDLENDYLTMSNDFIQSDWWTMKQAFSKGLLYKDFKIVPFCCRCGTGLSSHEVAQGYKDVTELTITAKFPLVGEPRTSIAAWTTTPWTLLGNVALTINADLEYSRVEIQGAAGAEIVILASEAIKRNEKALGKEYRVVGTLRGSELVGKRYMPLWDFHRVSEGRRLHELIADPFVTTEDGTGVVHMALYGEDDFRLIRKHGFLEVQHVGPDGRFTSACGPYAGRYFKEEGLDVEIVKELAQRNLLFDKHRHEHSYPHCWRCSTPLMYFAKASWFLRTTSFRDLMLSENAKINWQPPHIRDGRFGKWLENNVDWAISRDRYWGSPINIWTNETDPKDQICPASIAELQSMGATFASSGKPVSADIDLHIPAIDDVVIRRGGKTYRRESGVLDCWFNAGNMPWGQFGYPAKAGSEQIFASQFPADFICEGIDQTRGWFYTLLACSCLAKGQSSFRNVICTELVLDAAGKKMSKSLGNVIEPIGLIEKFGADAVRWTFYDSDPWLPKRYAEDLPREALRAVFIPIWNCYSFFVTYALLDGWTPTQRVSGSLRNELDRWILSAFRTTAQGVTRSLEEYDIARAAGAVSDFVEALSNWYIRRSRKRFWKSEDDVDKRSAYTTLYEVLVGLSKLLAPLAPFLAESMYQNLVRRGDPSQPESVHLCDWIDGSAYVQEPALEEEIAAIQEAASLARSLRTTHDLKVRQPLSKLMLTPQNATLGERLKRHLDSLAEEVNVKTIQIESDAASYVSLVVKPNLPVLGPRFGKKMGAVTAAIRALPLEHVGQLWRRQGVSISVAGETIELSPDDVLIEQRAKEGFVAQAGRSATVALETTLTPELLLEGDARELVSIIQRLRKESGFEISDRIVAGLYGGERIALVLQQHVALIERECLVAKLVQGELAAAPGSAFAVDVNGEQAKIYLTRHSQG